MDGVSLDESFEAYPSEQTIAASRRKAARIHFLLGVAAAAALIVPALTLWYPWPLFQVDGRGILPVVGLLIAVLLGPLAALALFRVRPERTAFDLLVIGLLQFTVLVYTAKAVYLSRPMYLVFTLDRFELVGAGDLDPGDLAKVEQEKFLHPPAAAPEYIAAVMPVEQSEQQRILFSSLGGKDLNLYPQYYVDYVEQVENILKRAKAIDPLLKRNRGAVSSYLESSGRTQEAVKYLPLRGRAQDAAVLVDALSGAPLEILMIDPW